LVEGVFNMFNFLKKILVNKKSLENNENVTPPQPPVLPQNKPQTDTPKVSTTVNYPENIKLSKQTTGQYTQKITPSAIVLHHTSGNYQGSIDWTNRVFDTNGKRLYASYHCIIARDGRRTITNLDDNRAYHAGPSSFKGKSSLNGWSLGVAWERDTYMEPLSDAAIESALEYIIPRMKKWGISPDNVTDHRTVSPGRKSDIAPKEYQKFMKLLRERWLKN
jgi:N-acetyl-anhydromuramyl-L-alanine amidase AmpD